MQEEVKGQEPDQGSEQGTVQETEPGKASKPSVVLRELLILTRAAIAILAFLTAYFLGKGAVHTIVTVIFMTVFVLLSLSYLYATFGKPLEQPLVGNRYFRNISLVIMGGVWIGFSFYADSEIAAVSGIQCTPDPCMYTFSNVDPAVVKISLAGGIIVCIEVLATIYHGPIYTKRTHPNIHPLDPAPVPVIGGF
ncbi:hypothetical protein BGX31_008175 [Mortierella sp. GBA43]|nr:hypothetical protein BGX31_008175 [Mortierella sp. GBA43]